MTYYSFSLPISLPRHGEKGRPSEATQGGKHNKIQTENGVEKFSHHHHHHQHSDTDEDLLGGVYGDSSLNSRSRGGRSISRSRVRQRNTSPFQRDDSREDDDICDKERRDRVGSLNLPRPQQSIGIPGVRVMSGSHSLSKTSTNTSNASNGSVGKFSIGNR